MFRQLSLKIFRLLSLVAILAALFTQPVDGYVQGNASIAGMVTDENGGKVVGAEVHLQSKGGIQFSSSTDQDGAFLFRDLGSGDYLLEVKAEGFSSFVSGDIFLERGSKQQLDVRLKVAVVSGTVVITATGTPQRTDDTAKVISVLDAQQLETKHLLSLTEDLRGIPGVRIQQQGSPGTLTTVRLRGLRNFDTALLLDGLRVRDASDINGSAVSLLTDLVPVGVDRVEVLRGSGSSIYGTNAIGGVINVVPLTGSGDARFTAGFEAGSLNTFRERFQGSGGGTRFGYSFALSRLDVRRGIDGQDQFGNSVGAGRLQFNPTSSITISGNAYGTIANSRINDSPFPLPAAFGSSEVYPRAQAGVTFQPDFNNPDRGRRNRLLVGSVRLAHQIDEKFSYTIAYQHVSSNRRNYNGPAIDPRFESFYPFGEFEFLSINKGTADTLDARLHVTLSRSNLLTAGFEFERESLFQQSIPSFGAFNNTTDRQRTFAVFGQDQLSFLDDRLQLSLAVRGQFFRIKAADRPDFLGSITAENSITGDGAVSYFIRSTNTKLRAHAGNGFRAPSLFERFGEGTFATAGFTRFGDPTLKAEQSISVDGGFDQRLADDKVLLGATYFYTRLQRVVSFKSFVVDPLGLGRFSGFVNDPGGLARGLETFFEARPFAGTTFGASYTYTNSDRAAASRGLVREYVIPTHFVGFTWNQRYRALLVNLDVNHTGSYIAPVFENDLPFRTAELSFSGYTKVDLFGSYEKRISEDVTAVFFGGAENLLNRTYFENGFRAPGILGRGGVNVRF